MVQLIVSGLKRLITVKTSAVTLAVPACCQLLMCLMPDRQTTLHKAAATELIQSGMVVLVAALKLEREIATIACTVICQKLVRPELPLEFASSAEEALLRYQAVPCLCKLLGADLPALPAPEAALDTDAHLRQVTWIQDTGLKQVPGRARTAVLLNRLLKRSPPPADPQPGPAHPNSSCL